jgi:hypothetical protein
VTLAHLSFRAGSVSDGYTHYFICNFSSLKNSKAKSLYRQDAADKSGFLVFLCALCGKNLYCSSLPSATGVIGVEFGANDVKKSPAAS